MRDGEMWRRDGVFVGVVVGGRVEAGVAGEGGG